MQKTAKEVAHFVTSHNQKQQQEPSKRQTQTAANRPQEVVCTEPKTTTNRIKHNRTTIYPNTHTPSIFTQTHNSTQLLNNR
jgi:hypothetical protein